MTAPAQLKGVPVLPLGKVPIGEEAFVVFYGAGAHWRTTRFSSWWAQGYDTEECRHYYVVSNQENGRLLADRLNADTTMNQGAE
ncbi:MAG TPA: hypothetical protein VNM48_06060 [Chloroflexota bacterium]|nr:hypothetical protein [Chloroflexota bacterium]